MINLLKKIFNKKELNSIPKESAFFHTSVPATSDSGFSTTSTYVDYVGEFDAVGHSDSLDSGHSDGGNSSDGGSCGFAGGGCD